MKKILSKEFIIGICVIIALLILFFGIDYLKGINLFKPANFYTAQYDNVAGLEIAAPVTIDGYKVGQVREINFNYNKPGKIEVVLALHKDLKLSKGSLAIIESSLMSGAFINLKMGSAHEKIPVGGEITGALSSDLMATISNDVLPAVSSILPKVDSLVYNLNLLAGDPALLQSIQRLDGISFNTLQATQGLNRTLNADIPLMMRNIRGITYKADSIASNLGEFSYKLKRLPLEQSIDNINELTSNLTDFSRQLKNQKSTLGMLTNDSELYNRINRICNDMDSLVVDIKRNPKRYVKISIF